MSRPNDKQEVGRTKAGKKIFAQKPEGCALYKLFFQGGGEVHSLMSGGFSTLAYAKKAANSYLAQKTERKSVEEVKAGAKAASKRPDTLTKSK